MKTRIASLFVAAFLTAGPAVGMAQTSQAPGSGPTGAKAEKGPDKADEMPRQTAVGRVKSVSPDSLVVMGKSKGQAAEWTFVLDEKTKIRKAGKDVTPIDLKEGDGVQVRYMEDGGKNIAQTVRARSTTPKPSDKPTEKKP